MGKALSAWDTEYCWQRNANWYRAQRFVILLSSRYFYYVRHSCRFHHFCPYHKYFVSPTIVTIAYVITIYIVLIYRRVLCARSVTFETGNNIAYNHCSPVITRTTSAREKKLSFLDFPLLVITVRNRLSSAATRVLLSTRDIGTQYYIIRFSRDSTVCRLFGIRNFFLLFLPRPKTATGHVTCARASHRSSAEIRTPRWPVRDG